MAQYVSARPRATVLAVLVAAQLLLVSLAFGCYAWASRALATDAHAAFALFDRAARLQRFDGVLYGFSVLVFLSWLYGATANLPALNPAGAERFYSPGQAIAYYFLPLVNLVLGYRVVASVWTESQPRVHGAQPRRPWLVIAWWAACIASTVIGFAAFEIPVDNAAWLHRTMLMLSVRDVGGILFLTVVLAAQRRQDEQWRDLELRRAVPQPTAEALR